MPILNRFCMFLLSPLMLSWCIHLHKCTYGRAHTHRNTRVWLWVFMWPSYACAHAWPAQTRALLFDATWSSSYAHTCGMAQHSRGLLFAPCSACQQTIETRVSACVFFLRENSDLVYTCCKCTFTQIWREILNMSARQLHDVVYTKANAYV